MHAGDEVPRSWCGSDARLRFCGQHSRLARRVLRTVYHAPESMSHGVLPGHQPGNSVGLSGRVVASGNSVALVGKGDDVEGGGIPRVWLRLALAALIITCFGVLVRNALRMVERKLLFPAGTAPFASAMKGASGTEYARLGVKAYTVPRGWGNTEAPAVGESLPIRYFAAFPPHRATPPATRAMKDCTGALRARGQMPGGGGRDECVASMVVFHGNAGTAEDRITELVPALTQLNLAVFLVEYPGYASDPSKTPPAERAILDNAVRAVDHLVLTGHVPRHAPLVLFGHSLGGAVATYVARQRPGLVHGLFLVSPFGSVAQVVGTRIPRIPFKWVIKSNFDANTWARGVVCPATIVHGSDDVIVPLHLAEKFAAQFTAAPDVVVVTHGTHNDMIATHPTHVWAACRRAVTSATAFRAAATELAAKGL